MSENEVELNVPWGQVTCTIYGDTTRNNDEIVLLIHDIHDNAASFSRVIENMNDSTKNRLCVALDLPGHGKSSRLQSHTPYHFGDYILTIKYVIYRILHHVKQDKRDTDFVLVGHGKSTHLVAVFTQLYPKLVAKLILLDGMYLYDYKRSDFRRNFREFIENYFRIEDIVMTKSPREYSLEDVQSVYRKKYNNENIKFYEMLGDMSEVENDTNKTVCAIADRSCRAIKNGNFLLRNDLQLDNIFMHMGGYDYMIDLLKKLPIVCPVLIICTEAQAIRHKLFLGTLKSKNKQVQVIKVPFEHYHIKKPRETNEFMSHFMSASKTNLIKVKL